MFRGFSGAAEDAAMLRDANSVQADLQSRPDFMAKVSEGSGFDYATWAAYAQFQNMLGTALTLPTLTDALREEIPARTLQMRQYLSTVMAVAPQLPPLVATTQPDGTVLIGHSNEPIAGAGDLPSGTVVQTVGAGGASGGGGLLSSPLLLIGIAAAAFFLLKD